MSAPADAPLRILLATADRGLESRLVDGLPAERVTVVLRALDGPTVLDLTVTDHRAALPAATTASDAIDVVVASVALHGLTEAAVRALLDRRMPVLLLAGNDAEAERFADLVPVVLASAPVAAIAEAVRRTHRGTPLPGDPLPPAATFVDVLDEATAGGVRGAVVAVTSGKGAPGVTTVALALAAEFGRRGAGTVLVDADLRGGNVAPYLHLDPRRGLVGLAAAGGPLTRRLEGEVQRGPDCDVLAGVERPELAAALTGELIASAVQMLRGRYERVVVDLGAAPAPAMLRSVDQVLLVTGADAVALWNARQALRALGEAAARSAAVVNRREGREHYAGEEVERAFGIPVLGVVREDRPAARQAIERHAPLTSTRGGAGGDLRALASTVDACVAAPASVLVAAALGPGA